MEKRTCEILRSGDQLWGRYFGIWRCQNEVQGPRDRENIVERRRYRFYALETLRFRL